MDAYEGYDDVVPPTGDGFDADGAGAGGAGGIDDLDGPLVVAAGDAAYFVDGLVGGPGAAGGNEALEEDAVIDNVVLKFLGNFQRAVREQNTGEIQNIYESSWNALSERFYAKSSWPSGNAVAAHFNDEGARRVLVTISAGGLGSRPGLVAVSRAAGRANQTRSFSSCTRNSTSATCT